jgi:hypothetical protein
LTESLFYYYWYQCKLFMRSSKWFLRKLVFWLSWKIAKMEFLPYKNKAAKCCILQTYQNSILHGFSINWKFTQKYYMKRFVYKNQYGFFWGSDQIVCGWSCTLICGPQKGLSVHLGRNFRGLLDFFCMERQCKNKDEISHFTISNLQ